MQKTKIIFAFSLLFLCGCANKGASDGLNHIPAFKNVTPFAINKIRRAAIQETAGSVGAQAALAWRSKQINDMLLQQSRTLDRIFNFNSLVLAHNVLPPVLVEGHNTLNLDNNETIRLSDRDYQIVFPARFITASPTWRDYLLMNYKKPDDPDTTLLPKNNEEREIWNLYLGKGWQAGLDQSAEIFSVNIGRLHRDFEGMILYRKLYAQKIVSAPFVSQADLGITGGGNNLRINDRVLRITAVSELNANSKTWKPVMTIKESNEDDAAWQSNSKGAAGIDAKLKSLMEKIK
jgi:defect-in-organelle-trafficking protein DotC